MSQPFTRPLTRRTLLTGSAAGLAALAVPSVAEAHGSRGIGFTLNAYTMDGGEQVTSLTLDTSRLGRIDEDSLTTSTFTVHAKATSPLPIPAGGAIYSEYDVDRVVTRARVNRRGDIVLELESLEGGLGGGTLGYMIPGGTNVRLDLEYTITQNSPLRLRNRRSVTIKRFKQGDLVNTEVDAYTYHESAGGMKYRLFSPERGRGHGHGRGRHGRKRPLIVWLHGGGEGGMGGQYYTNESTLRANRGALGFSTDEAQRIFGGAYVLAPQCITAWMRDGDGFAPQIKAVIDEVTRRYPIDRDRISVVGCSNGGYMSLKMTEVYEGFLASSVPICPGASETFFTDGELAAIDTPTWLVHSKDDTTLPYEPNSVRAHNLIPDSLITLYDNVTWNGHQFAGHWSWIYVARNDPSHNGQHIWQWMAEQER